MKTIRSEVGYEGTEHFVLDVPYEGITVDFVQQVDDVMITTVNGDLFISWENPKFSPTNCILLKMQDNLKEIGNVRCTHFQMMSTEPGKVVKTYLTGQRN